MSILGSFVPGVVAASAAERGSVRPEVFVFLTVWLWGGFTTMSAFSYDTVVLIQSGRATLGIVNVVVTLSTCFTAGWLGQLAGRLL